MIVRALAMLADVLLIAAALWLGTATATAWLHDGAEVRTRADARLAAPPVVDAVSPALGAPRKGVPRGENAGGTGPSRAVAPGLRGAAAPFSQSRLRFWSVRSGSPA